MNDEKDINTEIDDAFIDKFSASVITENPEQYKAVKKILISFIQSFRKDEIFLYMNERQETENISEYLSKIPQGIDYFENWLNNKLLNIASEILNHIKSTLPNDKVYLTFAHLLDSKNLNLFIKNSEFNEPDTQKVKTMLEPLLEEPDFDYLLQSLSCIYVGLNSSAISLLKLWVQSLWFDGVNVQTIINKARLIVAIREKSAKAGKKGATVRWSKKEQVKRFAIETYSKGTFKNPSQAANTITLDVINYSKSVGYVFASDFQATRTIYNWLLTYKKSCSK